MDSNTSIINFIIQIDKSTIVSDISTNNRLRHSRLLAYSRQLQEEENDDDEFSVHVNIYREHKRHLEQDKKSRTQLDVQDLDDLYEPVQDPSPRNSTSSISSSSDVDMSCFLSCSNNKGINPYNGTVIDGILKYNSSNSVEGICC
ncbi:1692_t:CDS:1 [Dentiscutata erythropus]|uniref:1692_t:CDS:1 n=1 Tax=Dentiscutata erythropus TaxID=1348616 RepID=A0A9N9I282_9GLOM|nr:1692_t:CDS:1 [Dentiscutata erythropus]